MKWVIVADREQQQFALLSIGHYNDTRCRQISLLCSIEEGKIVLYENTLEYDLFEDLGEWGVLACDLIDKIAY